MAQPGVAQPGVAQPGVAQRVLAQFAARPKRTALLVALLPLMVAVWIPLLRGERRPPARPAQGQGAAQALGERRGNAAARADPAAGSTAFPAAPLGETVGPDAPDALAALAARAALDVASLELDTLGERVGSACEPFQPRWSARPERDPFAAGLAPRPAEAAAAETRRDLLAPSSIFLSATRSPVAVIQGRAYREGDEVAGVVIVRIEERRVQFRDGDTEFAVSIPAPRVGGDRG